MIDDLRRSQGVGIKKWLQKLVAWYCVVQGMLQIWAVRLWSQVLGRVLLCGGDPCTRVSTYRDKFTPWVQ